MGWEIVMHGDKSVRCFLVGSNAVKMPASIQSDPSRTFKGMRFYTSSSSCKERREAFSFPCEKPTAAAVSSRNGSPLALIPVKPENGSARSMPAAVWPPAPAVLVRCGPFVCWLSSSKCRSPLCKLCFTGSPPVADLLYRESIWRGA